MNCLINRVALVTGASSGIGAAICKKLVKEGMIVVGCGRNYDKIDKMRHDPEVLKLPGKLFPIDCDLSRESDIVNMFDQIENDFGVLYVCINNAGFAKNSSLATGSPSDWKNMLDVNVLGLCMCTQESVRIMTEKTVPGMIIHMGCVMGHKVPNAPLNAPDVPALGAYYGTKFMVRGLAESLRQELKMINSPIRVATISPGATETEFYARTCNEEAAKKFYTSVKCLQPEDIAEEVLNVIKTPEYVNVQDIIVQPKDFYM